MITDEKTSIEGKLTVIEQIEQIEQSQKLKLISRKPNNSQPQQRAWGKALMRRQRARQQQGWGLGYIGGLAGAGLFGR